MKAREAIADIQTALLIPLEKQAPRIGPLTRAAFERLAQLKPDDVWVPPRDYLDLSKPGEGARDINAATRQLIQHFESCYLEAYRDSAGVWTIGWGHTGLQHKDGTVYAGRRITQEKANQLFRYDMDQFEGRVSSLVKVPLNDNQFGALVAFDFNTGGLTLKSGKPSMLLSLLNDGNYAGALKEWVKWDKVTNPKTGMKEVLRGLTRRRWSEVRLFEGVSNPVLTLAQLERALQGLPV